MEPSEHTEQPLRTHSFISKTWLSRSLDFSSVFNSLLSTFILIVGSVLYSQNLLEGREWIPASPIDVFQNHEYWKLWTTLFAHADEKHILSNSFLFFILGIFINGYFGKIVFPLLALIMGGVTNWIVLQSMPLQTHIIGASGVVFWMGGFWLMMYFFLDRRRSFYQRSIRAFGVSLMLFVPSEAFDPTISYQSHLIGFLLGVLCGVIYFQLNKFKLRSAEVVEYVVDEP